MKCYVHPEVDAVGTCTSCGKSVCSNCAVEMNGKVVCKACVDKMAAQPSPIVPPVVPPVVTPPTAPTEAVPSPAVVQPVTPPATPPLTPPVVPPVAPAAPARKEPFLSLILSFLGMFIFGFIGLGQIYNGQVKKAIILTVGNWVIGFSVGIIYLFSLATIIGFVCCLPVFLIPLLLWLYAMYDAYVTAEKINKGEPTKDWLD